MTVKIFKNDIEVEKELTGITSIVIGLLTAQFYNDNENTVYSVDLGEYRYFVKEDED